ncbi:MAG: outer membrane protein assembly factor BamD [Nitrospiraceae bacterium]|nr:outer membrane protein assembly factor BamD [Nitrospiraceae bacterium]
MTNIPRYIAIFSLIAIGLLAGCAGRNTIKFDKTSLASWFHSAVQTRPQENEIDLSEKAMRFFIRGRYLSAQDLFQKVKDRYPFSPYASLAELRLADCKFYLKSYEEAVLLYKEFEKLHPTNEALPYVIFQEGSCYYRLMATPDRDQTYTHRLIETYRRLLKRFPSSPFTYEAHIRIAKARERLAQHEIVVARWYLHTMQWPQAKNRLDTVLELYPDTSASSKAKRLLRKIPQEKETETWWSRLIPVI